MSATLVKQYMNSIAWYDPTTDTDDWAYFKKNCYGLDYDKNSTEYLKRVAWYFAAHFQPGLDVGMWTTLKNNFSDFLQKNILLTDDGGLSSELIQLDFIACFQNSYSQASHNNDLWQSFNDKAQEILKSTPIPITNTTVNTTNQLQAINATALWENAKIIEGYMEAIKELRLSYWAPTVDTDTWKAFQGVILDINAIPFVNITFKAALVISSLSSPVDPKPWSNLSSQAHAFLDKYLGFGNVEAYQLDIAITFFKIPMGGININSHNADLWTKYNTAFQNATNYVYSQSHSPLAIPVDELSAVISH